MINLNKLNKHVAYQHFKIEGLFTLKEVLPNRGLHVQNRSQERLFFSALASGISKICKVSMEGSVVSVVYNIEQRNVSK